jgi:cell division septal protein FtsQ
MNRRRVRKRLLIIAGSFLLLAIAYVGTFVLTIKYYNVMEHVSGAGDSRIDPARIYASSSLRLNVTYGTVFYPLLYGWQKYDGTQFVWKPAIP